MIKCLELFNFMSVRYVKHVFTPGMNVIRGVNEAGKSTLFVAIAYALWGAKALPSTLDDTVTWGQPVSSLKVCLTFSTGGEDYVITRSKSGASLAGGNLLSSGQTEVALAVERLTGADAATGSATMLANQGSLQSALEKTSLIEKLSDTALVDRLIQKVSENFVSGNTKALEAEIAVVLHKPEMDFSELERSVESARMQYSSSLSGLLTASRNVEEAEVGVELANKILQEKQIFLSKQKDLKSRLKPWMSEPQPPLEVLPVHLLELRRDKALKAKQILDAYKIYKSLPVVWSDGTLLWHKLQLRTLQQSSLNTEKALLKLKLDQATAQAQMILEESCSLCGKLLSDVPEVVVINSKVSAKLDSLKIDIDVLSEAQDKFKVEISKLTSLVALTEVTHAKLQSIANHCSIDYEFCPPKVSWQAGDIEESIDSTDYASAIAEVQKARVFHATEVERVRAHNKQVQDIVTELSNLVSIDSTDAEKTLVDFSLLVAEKQRASTDAANAEKVFTAYEAELSKQRAVFKSQCDSYNEALAAKKRLQITLTECRENNALITKLRGVKPVISKALWSLVLHSVSTVFSNLRGRYSIVTRFTDKFLIDGKPAESYSGSTKDVLGLAIRITLQRTFLPNLDFCLLDEPAAALDTVRETAMLAMLARIDFTQVTLVTHSELADTFAANVIAI